MNYLEEPPPPSRELPEKPAARNGGHWLRNAALFAVAGAAVAGPPVWMDHRLSAAEDDLAVTLTDLEDARASLALLWTTTTRLDASRVEEQDLLRDSIGLVRTYAEGGMRLWETAYEDHEQRVSLNAVQIRNQQGSIRRLLDATAGMTERLDALASRARSLQTDLEAEGQTVVALRQALSSLATRLETHRGQLEMHEGLLTAAGAEEARIASRVDIIELWVDSFRNENLDARTVRDRLVTLAADLRSIASRVDSLGLRVDSAHSAIPGQRRAQSRGSDTS